MSGSFKAVAADDRRKATENNIVRKGERLDTLSLSGQSNKPTGNERRLCLSVGGCSIQSNP